MDFEEQEEAYCLTAVQIFGTEGLDMLTCTVSIYNKRGPEDLENFYALDQLIFITRNSELVEFFATCTRQVVPMVNLFFKVCLENICPYLGARSNFAAQDVHIGW